MLSVIVAATQKGGIGLNGGFPWPKIEEDLQFFKTTTTAVSSPELKNALIMGRKTFESLKSKVLPGRLNVVLTSGSKLTEKEKELKDFKVCKTFQSALELCKARKDIDKIFAIGGEEVYREALALETCQTVFVTQILNDLAFDARFPPFPPEFSLESVGEVKQTGKIFYQFLRYKRQESRKQTPSLVLAEEKSADLLYFDLVQDVLAHGKKSSDRTGVGTLSVFGRQVRFNLSREFPICTTKSVYWTGVKEELLWFIRGCTDSKKLSEKKVKIWDKNGSREFLDKQGHKSRREGDLGPCYGFQWRYFGAEYKDCDTDYTGKGVDQLKDLVALIKRDPSSRRLILCSWNPCDLHLMALPPCHVLVQFYVRDGVLSSQMYQRSADLGLGVPFNMASYALLTCMMAQVCGLKPGEFVHTFGDLHIYLTHIDALKEQLTRSPKTAPRLVLNPKVSEIDGFTSEDIALEGYKPHPVIKMEMAL